MTEFEPAPKPKYPYLGLDPLVEKICGDFLIRLILRAYPPNGPTLREKLFYSTSYHTLVQIHKSVKI